MADALLFAPEIACLLAGLALFFCPVFEASYRTTWGLALFAALVITATCIWSLPLEGEPFAPGIYRVDFFSQLLKAVLALGFLLVVILSRTPQTLERSSWVEFPMFLLFSTLGMMMMISATELLTLYVSMELAAYPIYIAVALHRNQQLAGEGATKYMVQGMAASAISLYGMSFLFGVFGSTYFGDIALRFDAVSGQPIFWFGLLLALAGFLFKLSAFPFHFWAPDTYQSASHPLVTFIATASKVAAIALLCRLISLAMPFDAWDAQGPAIQSALMWMSIVAMTLGNLAALAQKDLKRLLGYSAVAHAGYTLIGVQTFSTLGLSAALFYALAYFAMSFICFLVVCVVGRDEDQVPIASMAGLYQRSPLLALTLLLGLFGLIGLPPTVGFTGKWFLFSAALERGQFYLVLVAAINSAVALYYYLLVIRQAYMEEPSSNAPLQVGPLLRATAVATMALTLIMGTFPDYFWDMAERAAAALVG